MMDNLQKAKMTRQILLKGKTHRIHAKRSMVRRDAGLESLDIANNLLELQNKAHTL